MILQLDMFGTPEAAPVAASAPAEIRPEGFAAWAERAEATKRMIADLRPTRLEPFEAFLGPRDWSVLAALHNSGCFMQCVETGRWFCPSLARPERITGEAGKRDRASVPLDRPAGAPAAREAE